MTAEPRPYFAYGSNLDTAQMAVRCPDAQCLGPARLDNYRFLIMARGYATIRPEADAAVHGLLWLLSETDERSLDRYEGVPAGGYRKALVTVSDAAGVSREVLTYIAACEAPGTPRAGYLEKIPRAARAHGLPAPYVEEIASWAAPHSA